MNQQQPQQRKEIHQVQVRVPATSANLGSGFDTAGLALEYWDDLTFTRHSGGAADGGSVEVIIHGEGEATLPRDERHLVVAAFRQAAREFGVPTFGFTLEAYNRIPQARGMGSSAEAIVAGVAAAAAFSGQDPLDRMRIFEVAASIEGHPDNVAPAVFGGLTVSWKRDGGFGTVTYPVAEALRAAVFIPDVELSTEMARQALPAEVPYGDAIYNVSRASLLPAALNAPSGLVGKDLLFEATQDRLHQPYRKTLMPASWELIERLRVQGFAASVSGAGPCVLVLDYGDEDEAIDRAASAQLGSGHWRVLHLPVNVSGVVVQSQ